MRTGLIILGVLLILSGLGAIGFGGAGVAHNSAQHDFFSKNREEILRNTAESKDIVANRLRMNNELIDDTNYYMNVAMMLIGGGSVVLIGGIWLTVAQLRKREA